MPLFLGAESPRYLVYIIGEGIKTYTFDKADVVIYGCPIISEENQVRDSITFSAFEPHNIPSLTFEFKSPTLIWSVTDPAGVGVVNIDFVITGGDPSAPVQSV